MLDYSASVEAEAFEEAKDAPGYEASAVQEPCQDPSPPLAPVAGVIDVAHLSRMTLGEHALEREVLELFDLQAATLLPRMMAGTPKAVAVLAHTLNGSARGIGAWKVSEAAEALERAATAPQPLVPGEAIGRLSAAVAETHAAISELLHAA